MLLTVVGHVGHGSTCLSAVCLKWMRGVILQFSVNTMMSNGVHICYAIHCDLELAVVAESERTKHMHLIYLLHDDNGHITLICVTITLQATLDLHDARH